MDAENVTGFEALLPVGVVSKEQDLQTEDSVVYAMVEILESGTDDDLEASMSQTLTPGARASRLTTTGEGLYAQHLNSRLQKNMTNGNLLEPDQVREIINKDIEDVSKSPLKAFRDAVAQFSVQKTKDTLIGVINEQFEAAKQYKRHFDSLSKKYEIAFEEKLDTPAKAIMHTLEAGLVFKGALPIIVSRTRDVAERFWVRRTGREGETCVDTVIRNSAYSEFTVERRMGEHWDQVIDKLKEKDSVKDTSIKSLQIAMTAESARRVWENRDKLGVHNEGLTEDVPIIYFHKLDDGSEYPVFFETQKGKALDCISIAQKLDNIKDVSDWSNSMGLLSPKMIAALRDAGYSLDELDQKGEVFKKLAQKMGIIISTDNDGDQEESVRHKNLENYDSSFINFNENTFHFRLSFDGLGRVRSINQRNNHRRIDGKEAKEVALFVCNNLGSIAADYLSDDTSRYVFDPKIEPIFTSSMNSLESADIAKTPQEINSEVLLSDWETLDLHQKARKLILEKNVPVSVAKLLPYVNLLLFPQSTAPTSQGVILGENGLDVKTVVMPANLKTVKGADIYSLYREYVREAELWGMTNADTYLSSKKDRVKLSQTILMESLSLEAGDSVSGDTDASFFSALSAFGVFSNPVEKINRRIGNILNSRKLGDLVAKPGGAIASCPTPFGRDIHEALRHEEHEFINSGASEKLDRAGVKVRSVISFSKETNFTTAGTENTMNVKDDEGSRSPSCAMTVVYEDNLEARLKFHFRSSRFNLQVVEDRIKKIDSTIDPSNLNLKLQNLQDTRVREVYLAYSFLFDLLDMNID